MVWVTQIILALLLIQGVSGSCYFPVEVQGEFMTQSLVDQEIAYTTVSILYNSIPGWGRCHKRHGARLLLVDTTVNGDTCYKCLRLSARSRNVLQVHSHGLYQCFSHEEEALSSCPSLQEVAQRGAREVMLYKTRSFHGESAVAQVRCPINGVWRFTYSNRGGGEGISCASPASRAGDCPSGYQLEFQFRGCGFPSLEGRREMHLRCLGDWQGEDGQRYLALMDTELPQLGEQIRPRYRCAIYKEDLSRGYTWLALSNDSTCTHQLDSHSAGYETLQLHSLKQSSGSNSREGVGYSLPSWAQGHWDDKTIWVTGGQLIYRSESDMTTYTAQSLSSPQQDRYLVRLESACGRPVYACLALEKRADNIIELMLGKQGKAPEPQLCSSENFVSSSWLTLGRKHALSSCPLQGEFSGALPDAEGLCARSVTSCKSPDLMQYQVFNCENKTEVYEDRSYLCYGVFHEGSLTYTVVQRLDLPRRECFVGVTLEKGQGMIAEAGQSCGRDKEPLRSGMLLAHQSDECVEWEWEESPEVRMPESLTERIETTSPESLGQGEEREEVTEGREQEVWGELGEVVSSTSGGKGLLSRGNVRDQSGLPGGQGDRTMMYPVNEAGGERDLELVYAVNQENRGSGSPKASKKPLLLGFLLLLLIVSFRE